MIIDPIKVLASFDFESYDERVEHWCNIITHIESEYSVSSGTDTGIDREVISTIARLRLLMKYSRTREEVPDFLKSNREHLEGLKETIAELDSKLGKLKELLSE